MEEKQKPIDRWLALFAIVVGIVLYLLPKTRPVIAACCAAIWLLLFHPAIKFWWVEKKTWRQVCALLLLTMTISYFGLNIPPEIHASKPTEQHVATYQFSPKDELKLDSYALRKANHANGDNVSGIKWNSHFTDLRVTISNISDEDFRDVDLYFYPGTLIRRAAINGERLGCDLIPLKDRNTWKSTRAKRSGSMTAQKHEGASGVDIQDSWGQIYTDEANSSYRIRCATFPSRYSMQIVFALIQLAPQFMHILPSKPGSWTVADVGGAKSFLDALGSRPNPSKVEVYGTYTRKSILFSIKGELLVAEGN